MQNLWNAEGVTLYPESLTEVITVRSWAKTGIIAEAGEGPVGIQIRLRAARKAESKPLRFRAGVDFVAGVIVKIDNVTGLLYHAKPSDWPGCFVIGRDSRAGSILQQAAPDSPLLIPATDE